MIVYKKTDKWYIEWQRVTASGTKSDNEWQRVTRNENEWYNEWQLMTTSDHFGWFFFFFQIREEPTNKHPKENSLNLEEDLWIKPIELTAETSTQEEILTVRSGNWRSSCLQIFIKISEIKDFAIFTGKHLCWSPFSRKLQVLNPASLLKGDSNTGVFQWILRNF